MAYPLLPLFLVGTLGAGPAFLGVVEGIAESTSSLAKLGSGFLSDRVGRRKVLVVGGYALASLVRPLLAMATAPWHVLAVRFTDRIGKGVRSAPRDALLVDSVPPDRKGTAFGLHRAADHAGSVLGPLLAAGLLFLAPGNLRLVFTLTVIPGVITVLVLTRGVREIAPEPTPIMDRSTHLSKMVWNILGGMLSDRIRPLGLILSGWLVYAAVYTGFGLAHTAWHAWALFGIYGLFYGLTESPEKTLVAELAPSHLRARAFGVFHFVVGLGALPASLLFGVLWQWKGAPAAFGTGAAIALVSAGFLPLALRRRARSSK